MTVFVKVSVILLWFLQYYLGETGTICQPGLTCVSLQYCEIQLNEGEILYPCRNGVCCPKLKNSIISTTVRYEPFNTIKTSRYDTNFHTDHEENRRRVTTTVYENTPYLSHLREEVTTPYVNVQRSVYSNDHKNGNYNLNTGNNEVYVHSKPNNACERGFVCVRLKDCEKFNTEGVFYPCDKLDGKVCCPRPENRTNNYSSTQKYEPFNTIKPFMYPETNLHANSYTDSGVQVDRTTTTKSEYNYAIGIDSLLYNYSSTDKTQENNDLQSNQNTVAATNSVYNLLNSGTISSQDLNRNKDTPPVPQDNGLDQNKTSETTRKSIFSNKCGLTNSQDKITGGKIAEMGQFPWMALLGFKHRSAQSLQFLCGGSLITKRDVLTAAHCIVENRHLELYSIRLGEYNLTTERDCVQVGKYKTCADHHVDIGIEKVTIHPKFNRRNFKNDIAIIRIRREVEMTDFIRTICLPFDKDYSNFDMTGQNFTVSGWGKSSSGDLFGTNEIQYAKVTTWDPIKCNNSLPSEVKPISTTQLCANGAKSEDACKGDSGGPLINVTLDRNLEVKHIQFGIVSFGTGTCGDKNLPSVYTRVDRYLEWISKTVSNVS